MALSKFQVDRQPRRDDLQAAMTVWAVLLNLVDWINSGIIGNFKSGSTTVAQGNTTAVVSHGLGNPAYQIALTPALNPNAYWWVTGKGASQFTINLSVAAPVGGIPFGWLVKAD